ncbi:hypothetical protein RHOFW510R12_06275 [Rhodanobacter sp. FW510-R12]|uniref:hypothetical protein n=1 Tax=unclassified Rhodanobacter TaxID=2621553 RepID=UPI0007AA0005|nr:MULTISPECIES: hypothetical protein [unclassified Rhodanobacter]KZC16511.1 hypothetical protein RHOFW104R8_16560 [Rhodanobacter sp. FW104-R8]KZC25948.1 hypothetical protein RhoFW510T8_05050 [Rhodanobacter sp. FW510-T8]KZC31525.1 hypothetical protein RhoFW510R10_17425 [Rhodanobacter sp. FW510-R10]
MPSNSCHPCAPHVKLKAPDWYVSALMLDRALDAILRRVKKLDRTHDIPYLAGYSKDGKTIYIDRHLPKSFTFRGRTVEVDRFLILHEEVEKTLIDQLGLHYLHAHQIATRAEEAAVNAERITWAAYDRFMQKYVKSVGDERLTRVPADLDLKPYRDYHDYDLLQRMLQGIDEGRLSGPDASAKKRDELKAYADAFREERRLERSRVSAKSAGARKGSAGAAAAKLASEKKMAAGRPAQTGRTRVSGRSG